MTKLLEQALAKVAKLPEAEQEAIAAVIWGELKKHGQQARKMLVTLPSEKRHDLLVAQAERLLEHYQNQDWRDTEIGDLLEY